METEVAKSVKQASRSFSHERFNRKKEYKIVQINKDEKDKILKAYPDAHIVRLMKQDSKRHHYWMTEEPHLMKALQKLRKF